MVIVNGIGAVLFLGLLFSLAVTLNLKTLEVNFLEKVLGIPEITPVDLFKFNPLGNVPVLIHR